MDFIVQLPPCRPADSDTRIQGLQQSETCTGGMETWAADVGRAGFHLLNSPFSVLHLKNDKVAPWRTPGKRWARSYSQEQAQLFELEAAFGPRPEGEVFPHFINQLGSLCLSFTISGTSPSPLRSPGQTQPPYSRVETHGRRVTSWSPLGFRTDEEEERGVGRICVQVLPLPQTDVWTVQQQSGTRVSATNGWKEASPRRPLELSGCVSVHVVKFTSFSCPGDIKGKLIQSQGRLADVCRREGLGGGGMGTGCCCYGNAAYLSCCEIIVRN